MNTIIAKIQNIFLGPEKATDITLYIHHRHILDGGVEFQHNHLYQLSCPKNWPFRIGAVFVNNAPKRSRISVRFPSQEGDGYTVLPSKRCTMPLYDTGVCRPIHSVSVTTLPKSENTDRELVECKAVTHIRTERPEDDISVLDFSGFEKLVETNQFTAFGLGSDAHIISVDSPNVFLHGTSHIRIRTSRNTTLFYVPKRNNVRITVRLSNQKPIQFVDLNFDPSGGFPLNTCLRQEVRKPALLSYNEVANLLSDLAKNTKYEL